MHLLQNGRYIQCDCYDFLSLYTYIYIHVYIFTNNTTHGFTKIQERSEAQLSKNIYIYIW